MKTYNYVMNPRVLYILLVTSCTVILTLSFTSWNREKLFIDEYENASSDSLRYSIDSCGVNKSTLFIKGWLFNDTYPQEGSLIVTAKLDDREIAIPSFTYVRDDVAQAFSRNEAFDNVGFNASISRHLIAPSKNIEFKFYVRNNKGKISKVLSYECIQ